MKKNFLKSSKGFSITFIFLSMVILFTLATLFAYIYSGNTPVLGREEINKRATLAAEYGVSRAIAKIRQEPSWTGFMSGMMGREPAFKDRDMHFSRDRFRVWVCNNFYGTREKTCAGNVKVPPGRCYILGIGKADNGALVKSEKYAAALIEKSNPFADFALFGDESIHINGKIRVYSFDSTTGKLTDKHANLGTNENRKNALHFNGSRGEIDGSVFLGPGLTGSLVQVKLDPGDVKLRGDKKKLLWHRPMPPVKIPENIYCHNMGELYSEDWKSVEPGKYDETLIAGDGQVYVLDGPGDYYFKGIEVSGDGRITADTTKGLIRIFLDGNLACNGNTPYSGVVNLDRSGVPQSSNLLIYGTDNCKKITLNGDRHHYQGVYARNAEITLSGNGSFYGSFIGNRINIEGNPSVVYDPSLGDLEKEMMMIKLVSWQRF